MTDSSATAAAGQGAVIAEEPADRIYDSYSDRDDNSSIAPFPPYRERDDYEDSLLEVAEQVVDAPAPDDDGALSDSMPTPTPLSAGDNDGADASTRMRLFSDAAQPPSSASSNGEAELATEPPAKTPSPQPAPPPPYWKHSRDASSSSQAAASASEQGQGREQDQGEEQEQERPAPRSSTEQTEAASAVAAKPAKPKPKSKPKGLSIFSRPTASRPAASDNSSKKSDGSFLSPGSQNGHRRDTSSSSTLDFNANQITLQDNEAAEDTAAYNDAVASQAGAASNTRSTQNAHGSGPSSNAWLFGLDDAPAAASGSATTAVSGTAKPKTSRCWARRVDIIDYTVINGSGGGISLGGGNSHPRIGAFVVWTVRVETLGSALPFSASASASMSLSPTARAPSSPSPSRYVYAGSAPTAATATSPTPTGTTFCIYKRYSEFDTLRRRLVASFPQARGGGALPPLPPKSVLGKFRPSFLEQRRLGLQYFLNCILLNPEFSGSPVLQEFLFE